MSTSSIEKRKHKSINCNNYTTDSSKKIKVNNNNNNNNDSDDDDDYDIKGNYMGHNNASSKIDIDNMMIKDFRVFCSSENTPDIYIKQMKMFMEYVQNYKSSDHLIRAIINHFGAGYGSKNIQMIFEIKYFIKHIQEKYSETFSYKFSSLIEILQDIKVTANNKAKGEKLTGDNKDAFERVVSLMIDLHFRHTYDDDYGHIDVIKTVKHKIYDEKQIQYINSIILLNSNNDDKEKDNLENSIYTDTGFVYIAF